MKIPSDNNWMQSNKGDIFGVIWSSFNLDLFSKLGKVLVSPRMMWTTSSATTGFQTPLAFKKLNITGNSFWYTIGGDFIWRGGTDIEDAFVKESGLATGVVSLAGYRDSDMEVYGGRLYVAHQSLERQDADATDWDTVTSLSVTSGLPLIVFKKRLYYKYSYFQMGSIDIAETVVNPSGTDNTNVYALSLLNENVEDITCGRANSESIWLGTLRSIGQKATVEKWDGASLSVSNSYKIDAQAILGITIKEDTPYIFDSNGILRVFNGGTFKEVARLPFRNNKRLLDPIADPTVRLMHPNGIITKENGDIALLINGKYDDSTNEENIQSGVWIYNEQRGLYHSNSTSLWNFGVTETPTDFGQAKLLEVGALAEAKSFDSTVDGDLVAGVQHVGGVYYAQFTNSLDTKQKVGYVVTNKIYSTEITDTWQKLVTRFRRFLTSTDKIIVKYRTIDSPVTEATITWISTTSFTTTTSLSTYEIGDEVEIISGIGAGKLSHITAIQQGATEWIVNVDETYTGATSTGTARLQKWTKAGEYSAQNAEFNGFNLGDVGTWVQLKIYMIFTGQNELDDLLLISKEHEKVV